LRLHFWLFVKFTKSDTYLALTAALAVGFRPPYIVHLIKLFGAGAFSIIHPHGIAVRLFALIFLAIHYICKKRYIPRFDRGAGGGLSPTLYCSSY